MPLPEQLPFEFDHRIARGVSDFLVGTSNRRAIEWIDRWPDWPFTALVVVGPLGSGKTHLAALWKAQSCAEVVELSSGNIERAAAIAASGRPVLIDDCDLTLQTPAAERALLQLYNLMRAAKGQLFLTAARSPAEWQIDLPDLKSRLNSAMIVTIDPPDDRMLASVAVKLFSDRQVAVGEDVIAYLVNRGERSFEGLARAVDALDRAALAAKRPITSVLAREILARTNQHDEMNEV